MAAPAVAALAEASEANCKTLVQGGAMASMMQVVALIESGGHVEEVAEAWSGVAGLCRSDGTAVLFIQHGGAPTGAWCNSPYPGIPRAYRAAQVKHSPLAEAAVNALHVVLNRAPLKVSSELGCRTFMMVAALAGAVSERNSL